MKLWNDENKESALVKERLYTLVVGDILDEPRHYHQPLPQDTRPLRGGMRLAGKAMTVLMTDVYEPQKKPFRLLTEALDQLKENEIYVAAGGAERCVYWGKLLTAAARTRRASGAMVNGQHRDAPRVLSQDWPIPSCGCYAWGPSVRTQVVGFRCSVEVGQIRIHDGDLIFDDVDGVLVIPREATDEALIKALRKAAGEKTVGKAVEDGMSATDAFARFGILWRRDDEPDGWSNGNNTKGTSD